MTENTQDMKEQGQQTEQPMEFERRWRGWRRL